MDDDWVAVLFAAWFTDSKGRLRAGLTLPDRGVRVALLLDLALRGRLSADGAGLSLDTTPTGFAPADRLLAHVEARPDRPITDLLSRAPISALDVADPQRGRRRTVRLGPELVKRARAIAQDAAEAGEPAKIKGRTPVMLALLTGAVGFTDAGHRGALLDRCGDLRPLASDCVDYLVQLADHMRWLNAAMSSGGGGG